MKESGNLCIPTSTKLPVLPHELWLGYILHHISFVDLCRLSSVCKLFQAYGCDSGVWERRWRQDFESKVSKSDFNFKNHLKACENENGIQSRPDGVPSVLPGVDTDAGSTPRRSVNWKILYKRYHQLQHIYDDSTVRRQREEDQLEYLARASVTYRWTNGEHTEEQAPDSSLYQVSPSETDLISIFIPLQVVTQVGHTITRKLSAQQTFSDIPSISSRSLLSFTRMARNPSPVSAKNVAGMVFVREQSFLAKL
jgi:hypothetical protein